MRIIIISAVFFFFCAYLQAQISVSSFKVLPNDLDARTYYPVKDQNGKTCALIKVVSTEEGFVWETGSIGVMKWEWKTGEHWVYIPAGARKFTIKHDKFGILRNYIFPQALEEATVYEMVLETGTPATEIPKGIQAEWLTVITDPPGADLYINDIYAGTTPYKRKLKRKEYTYRVSKAKHSPVAGVFNLQEAKENEVLNIQLKPDYGSISINSTPETGAEVFIDDEPTGLSTPCTLYEIKSGEHILSLRKEWYHPYTQKINLTAKDKKDVEARLIPSYGKIKIVTEPVSDIYIDNEKVGYGEYTTRLLPAVYEISAKKEKHHIDSRLLEVQVGDDRILSLNPVAKAGSIEIKSEPAGATIIINGKEYGNTPKKINNLLMGQYDVIVLKEGHGPYTGTFDLNENEVRRINPKLKSARKVQFTSNPAGAELYIDGRYLSLTPYTSNLSYTQHEIKLKKESYLEVVDTIGTDIEDEMHFNLEKLQYTYEIISRPPKADIYINDSLYGQSPVEIELPKGRYEVKLMKKGYIPYKGNVKLKNGGIAKKYKLRSHDIYLLGYGKGEHWSNFELALVISRIMIGFEFSFIKEYDPGISLIKRKVNPNYMPAYAFSEPMGYYINHSGGGSGIGPGMLYKIESGFRLIKPINLILKAGYAFGKFESVEYFFRATQDYYDPDDALILKEGQYYSQYPVEKKVKSLIAGAKLPLFFTTTFGFFVGADYWFNPPFDQNYSLSAGIVLRAAE